MAVSILHTAAFHVGDLQWLFLFRLCVPTHFVFFLLLLFVYTLTHTHTGITGGKYVCVHLYMYWWYAIAVMMNMLTLVMLPLVYVISQMHTHSLSHTHTGVENQRLLRVAREAEEPTEDQLKRVANAYTFTTANRKYLAHCCISCWWFAMAVSVPFVCSYSLCLLLTFFLRLCTHTHRHRRW